MKISLKQIQIIITIITLFVAKSSYATDKIDSLLNDLNTADEIRQIEVLENLATQYLKTGDYKNSAYNYRLAIKKSKSINDFKKAGDLLHKLGQQFSNYQSEYDSALTIFREATSLRVEIGDYEGANKSLVNIASIYIATSNFEKAIFFADSAIWAAELSDYTRGLGFAYSQKANGYHYRGTYEESIKYYQEALKIFEDIEHHGGISSCINNIGIGLQNIAKHDESLLYFRRSLQIALSQNNKIGIAQAYQNIGSYYFIKVKNSSDNNMLNLLVDSMKIYYQQAYDIYNSEGYEIQLASATTNLGNAYSLIGELELSNKYLLEANNYLVKSDNKYELVVNYAALGLNYLSMGKYQEALINLTKGQKLAETIKVSENLMMIHRYFTRAYDSLGLYQKALSNLYRYVELQDTVRNEKSREIIEELKTQYETEKKEQEIANQRAINNKQKEINQQQQRLVIYSLIGVLVVLIFLVLMIVQYVQKRKANELLIIQNDEITKQKKEIEQQRDEIEAQRDEIEAQRDQVVSQRDLIAEQQRNIMASIHYAGRIQEALLPQNDYLDKYLNKNYFVLFKPRDIVSGDFYWFGQKNHKNIIVAADCTGHGVPGAFMSMLGTAFLNEIIAKDEVITADSFLNTLREYVITSLKQTGKQGEQKDGMDISLYIMDNEKKQIQFAGANNSMLIIRKYNGKMLNSDNPRISSQLFTQEKTETQFEIIQLKADKMPIGIYADNRPFTSIDFDVLDGDILYTFSDGYQDQFGGPKNKKFMIKNLKQLLVNCNDKPMNVQHQILETTIESWKNFYQKTDQVDDILVIGHKIS